MYVIPTFNNGWVEFKIFDTLTFLVHQHNDVYIEKVACFWLARNFVEFLMQNENFLMGIFTNLLTLRLVFYSKAIQFALLLKTPSF